MTNFDITEEEIYAKAAALYIGKNKVEYIEKELETKLCKECAHLVDPSLFEFGMTSIEDMLFCSQCGGELEENTNMDQVKPECICCGEDIVDHEEGFVTKDKQMAVCCACYDDIPDECYSPEELAEMEKQKQKKANEPRLRMIAPSELKNKTIERSYHVEWNGAFVVHTTDNCICVTYSQYDHFSGKTTHDHLTDLNDYFRLC